MADYILLLQETVNEEKVENIHRAESIVTLTL